MDRDYDRYDRPPTPEYYDWEDEDRIGDRRYRERFTADSGWGATPVTARREGDRDRPRRDRDRDEEPRRYGGAWDRNRGRYDFEARRDDDRERRDYGYRGGRYWRGYGADSERFGRGDEDETRYGRRYAGYEAKGPYYSPMGTTHSESWRVTGPHTGRGPRGYRRSDDRIWEDVCEVLTQHGELDAGDVEVRVRDGEVTLDGTVDSRWAKRHVEDVVEEVRGVRDVHNRLRIRQEGPTEQGRGYRDVYSPGTAATGQTTGTTTGMTGTARNVMTEMTVWGADGDQIGTVKDVRGSDFLVDRAMQRDVYVPFSAVQSVTDDGVRLNVAGGDVDNMGWEHPPLVEGDMGGVETHP